MTHVLRVELPSRRATSALARRLAQTIAAGDLVVLSGPLGAGKTFFVRALCRALGLPPNVRVTSPTFTLIHEYETEPPVSHADVYRLAAAPDVAALGLDAARDDGRALLVEWGEPFVRELGGDALIIRLSFEPRRAELVATGPRGEAMLRRMQEPEP
jgi:tRNA threonylcarbamoyladenosine biosynthesis protein TsaE